jgi:hypothetical protein
MLTYVIIITISVIIAIYTDVTVTLTQFTLHLFLHIRVCSINTALKEDKRYDTKVRTRQGRRQDKAEGG